MPQTQTLLEKWSLQYNMAGNLSTGMAPEGAKKLRSSQETTATLHEVLTPHKPFD